MKAYFYNLNQCFAAVSSEHSTCVALRYPERTISYDELTNWADRLTQKLIDLGCQRGDVIAIGHNKHPLSYALMLAALKLGIAYVNIDVGSPLVRSACILQTSGVSFLFFDDLAYQETMGALARKQGCPFIHLSVSLLPNVTDQDLEQQRCLSTLVDGATIAYVMFTSGSTGNPKGVAVTHQNVLHFIAWGQTRFGISAKDNFANLSPMYFDNSVFDFYIGLFSGASLSPVPREFLTNPYELSAYVKKLTCTIWFSVPSLLIYLMAMKALTKDTLPTIRCIVFGGEGYPKVELKKLYDLFARQASLINVYGPTECTCICSAHTLSIADFNDMQGLPTLGQLNPNFDYRIVDEDEKDALTGELYLIGPNVASGYFNEPERTEAVFHTITSPNRYMKRLYKTGDIVREEIGRLYFVGRKDNQIKHMGYRIELEEIEHALVKLSSVAQAAVIYHRSHTSFGKLIAYVACADDIETEGLLQSLRELIPEYMMPAKIIKMRTLPKNSNGKVDRQYLRELLDAQ